MAEALLLPAPVGGSGCAVTVAGGVVDLDAIGKIDLFYRVDASRHATSYNIREHISAEKYICRVVRCACVVAE